MPYLFLPDAEVLRAADLSAFATVPFLLDDQLEYLDAPNRSLRERALGNWHPRTGAKSLFELRGDHGKRNWVGGQRSA